MMASPSELSLECKPHSYSMLLKSFGEKLTDQTQNLEEFLARLEEERLKIDAFKRELPLCMQLLTNAVEASRQQLQSYKEKNQGAIRPVLEEFIPLKMNANAEGGEKVSNTSDNKANWMTSAQLWSPGSDQETKEKSTITKETDHMGFSKIAIDHHNKEIKNGGVGGGGFLPFTKDSHNNNSCLSPTVLALAPSSNNKQNHHEIMDHHHHHQDNKNLETVLNYSSGNKANNSSTPISSEQGGGKLLLGDSQSTAVATNSTTTTTSGGGQQPHRKARRCWSPDLHRRFVNALQMLGGSQVATPKQIRELMKVDGLTNDEVKSHLQKYRLHTRRPSPSPQAAATAAPHLVVLGGIWVPPEYATAAHGGAPTAATLYGPHPTNHAPPQHYIAAPQAVGAHQEFYTPQPLQSLHGHLQHQQLYHHGSHMYNNNNSNNKPPASNSITHSQPESDVGGSGHGDRSESIEDGKSECSS